jgi:hypothetical protein
MLISEKLPQFEDRLTLIATISPMDAVHYIAKNGEINRIGEDHTEMPSYSDNEGFFERSGGGEVLGSGAPRETNNVKKHESALFLKQAAYKLEKDVKEHNPKEIILFVPSEVEHTYLEHLQDQTKEMIAYKLEGNFTETHPTEILERIHEQFEKKQQLAKDWFMPKEARKILEKTEDANVSR